MNDRRLFALGTTALVTLFSTFSPSAIGQVVTDGTTGPGGALDGPDYQIDSDLGTEAGNNLFHSFDEFSIGTGESATFNGPGNIQNIIGRVTGGNISSIDGRLASTIPGADLWLFNPAGVVLGANASLDLTGSFHVSTADEVRQADGSTFSAANPQSSGFSVAAPESFGFLSADPAGITINGSQLAVDAGETLSVVGGDVDIGGGAELLVAEGQLNVLAAGGPANANLTTGALSGNTTGDISISGASTVASVGDGGGSVKIRGGEFVVDGGSLVASNNTGATDGDVAVDVNVARLEVAENAEIATVAFGDGDGGDLSVTADTVQLQSGGSLNSRTSGGGDGGSIDIAASELTSSAGIISSGSIGSATGKSGDITVAADQIDLRNGSDIVNFTNTDADSGTVTIQAGNLSAVTDAQIRTFTNASGNAGDITVGADNILFDNAIDRFTGVISVTDVGSAGNAGSILVTADNLILRNGGVLGSAVAGDGNAGIIDVAANDILIDGVGEGGSQAAIFSLTRFESAGTSANISLNANTINALNGGSIFTEAGGLGTAGNITIEAQAFTVDGGASGTISRISASALLGGQTGNIEIRAGTLDVLSTAAIAVFGTGAGEPGQIIINADRITVDGRGGSDTPATISSGGSDDADAGNITIDAGQLILVDRGSISGITIGSGDGGSIDINAGTIIIDGQNSPGFTGVISSTLGGATGDAGEITIVADSLQIRNEGVVTNSTITSGNAGAIIISAGQLTIEGSPDADADSDTGIISDTNSEGRGGIIAINSNDLAILGGGAQISTSTAGSGDAGEVAVDATRITVDGRDEAGFSGITSQATSVSTGNAGSVQVTSDSLVLQNEAQLSSASFGTGRGGDVIVNAQAILINAGNTNDGIVTGITASVDPRGEQNDGDAGRIRINSGTLTMIGDTAEIVSTNSGGGDSGSISISLTDGLVLSDGADISTSAASGGGGQISIDAGRFVALSPGSQIVTNVVQDAGDAGNIDIRTSLLAVNEGSILAQADAGQGGDIDISVDDLLLSPGAVINADAGATGIDGTVQVTTPEADISAGLVVLDEETIDAASLLRARCAARSAGEESSFTAAGRGGLAPTPDDHLRSSMAPETMTLTMTDEGDLIAVPAGFDSSVCHGAL